MQPQTASTTALVEQPFGLLRWFSIASLAVIAVIAVANALVLSNFLSDRMLEREAQVTRDFVQNVFIADRSVGYLATPADPQLAQRFGGSVEHFSAMQGVLRDNVYLRDGTVLWSTDPQLIGRKFADNDELDKALKGELVVNSGRITDALRRKPEHVGLHPDSDFFVETYIPATDPAHGTVLGVVEVYKAPVQLTAAIGAGHRQVWAVALGGALVLYATLFWIVYRADRTIRRQHHRLIEAETLAAVGELASSVAHNIRNPLASIRSSAELALEMKGENCSEQARDIIVGADRIETWMQEFVRFMRTGSGPRAPIDAAMLLRECFADFGRDFERRKLASTIAIEARDPAGIRVSADAAVLGHALHSILANAVDATPEGGRIEGRLTASAAGRVAISIQDTGHGIEPRNLKSIFRPFFTTKAQGLGLGLTQARRAVERFGGEIRVDSAPNRGTTVTLELPAA